MTFILTRSIRDSETAIDFVQGPPGSRREWVNQSLTFSLLHSWQCLKAALIEKRSKLGESHTLQQFSRDADEVEAWIAEKFQVATDQSYQDPSNIQSKHQKHQAFEAEVAANAERIQAIMAVGQREYH